MPVNETLSTYSDMAYATSVVVYILAMLLYFAEFSRGRVGAVERKRESALVGAGSGDSGSTPVVGHVPAPEKRPFSERLGGMAVAMTSLGAVVHFSSLLLRGLATGRVPWGNMYEFGSAICLASVLAWLVVLFRQTRTARRDTTSSQLRGLGGFLMLPVVLLLFLSGTVLYAQAAPLIPALQSYWIVIHVAAAIVSSGVFVFGGVASVLYLLRCRYENNPLKMTKIGSRLPTSQALDRVAYRATVIIFPVWTFAIVAGAIWAEAAWGRFWGWDPKETCSFVAWVVYAAYLHARATAGWRGVRAAWINILGLAVMIFNLFFINIVVAGLHSYAGL
ncbi:c-type cytochrome biogenesis protein CcsB [Saccharopolyspora oryzae]|uniref:C-type cytochrome biogenesis protein CcsB n=1 Tax=Saccharopolyspora oryzae TaxID=2997343 RepID=A0ABT4V2A3_9PSEU|nr:c-type cytochrome biogenesis protein CcsB [Saccharopolyspora oryzae]MDA3628091.1 c-type cytochrome biogenesis protein CcsB [Saccharopolyspora oryzae]